MFVNPSTEDTGHDYDPAYRRGWRGPYLLNPGADYPSAAGFTAYWRGGDPAVLDGWGRPIVIQNPGLVDLLGTCGWCPPDRTAGSTSIRSRLSEDLTLDANDGDDVYVAFTLR